MYVSLQYERARVGLKELGLLVHAGRHVLLVLLVTREIKFAWHSFEIDATSPLLWGGGGG